MKTELVYARDSKDNSPLMAKCPFCEAESYISFYQTYISEINYSNGREYIPVGIADLPMVAKGCIHCKDVLFKGFVEGGTIFVFVV